MATVTGKLLAQLCDTLLRDKTVVPVTVVARNSTSWILNYGGALHITAAQRGEQIETGLVPIPRKCNPNYINAAQLDLNTALLKAAKQVFGITY